MRIFAAMKERLNLTVDGVLLEAMKAYAASKEMSVSELVESYFRSVTRPARGDSILDLLEGLERPEWDVETAAGNPAYVGNPAYADNAAYAAKEGGERHGF
jgi:hypothetical protein